MHIDTLMKIKLLPNYIMVAKEVEREDDGSWLVLATSSQYRSDGLMIDPGSRVFGSKFSLVLEWPDVVDKLHGVVQSSTAVRYSIVGMMHTESVVGILRAR